jgi:hypothetical protein
MSVAEPTMRKVMKWLDEQGQERPGASRVALVDEASRRFDLTPVQADFLLRHLAQGEPAPQHP